jgi:hypothetical protein
MGVSWVGLDGVKDGADSEKDEPNERSGLVPDDFADVSAAAAERRFSAADILSARCLVN